jgi:hypothetical protein
VSLQKSCVQQLLETGRPCSLGPSTLDRPPPSLCLQSTPERPCRIVDPALTRFIVLLPLLVYREPRGLAVSGRARRRPFECFSQRMCRTLTRIRRQRSGRPAFAAFSFFESSTDLGFSCLTPLGLALAGMTRVDQIKLGPRSQLALHHSVTFNCPDVEFNLHIHGIHAE